MCIYIPHIDIIFTPRTNINRIYHYILNSQYGIEYNYGSDLCYDRHEFKMYGVIMLNNQYLLQ